MPLTKKELSQIKDTVIDAIAPYFGGIQKNFNNIYEYFNKVGEHFDKIDERFDKVNGRLEKIAKSLGVSVADLFKD